MIKTVFIIRKKIHKEYTLVNNIQTRGRSMVGSAKNHNVLHFAGFFIKSKRNLCLVPTFWLLDQEIPDLF